MPAFDDAVVVVVIAGLCSACFDADFRTAGPEFVVLECDDACFDALGVE